MLSETIKIEIDGEEIADLYDDLEGVEVELDDELPAMFRLRFAIGRTEDGTWTLIDDERLRIWAPVLVSVGLEGDLERLIRGHVTHVRPTFHPDPTQCVLDVWGLDRSVLLDREDRLVGWGNKKDSDIAVAIFDEYGFDYEVQNTAVVHDEAVSTIIQRETDWRFLNRLAKRNGFDCYVEDTTGYFEPSPRTRRPQAVLAVHFGNETNVQDLALEVNALTPTNVALHQVERGTKEIVSASVESADEPALGAVGAVPGAGIAAGLVVLKETMTTGPAEMTSVGKALFAQQAWFVTGRGEVAANELGVILRPRRPVTVKGVGRCYSGVYLISHVTHAFSDDGYVQRFELKRNALEPTGSEDFS